MMKINVELLKDKIQAVTEGMGFELAELAAPVVGGRLILRAFIYSPQGITLDDCARVSRGLSDMLDTDDPISARYTLEVSSLGLDRPLLTIRDFQRRVGEHMRVSYQGGNGQKVIEGILRFCDDENLKIEVESETVTIPVDSNPRGRIII